MCIYKCFRISSVFACNCLSVYSVTHVVFIVFTCIGADSSRLRELAGVCLCVYMFVFNDLDV